MGDVNRISTRSSHKDLCDIMQGHLEYFSRASSRSHRHEIFMILPGSLRWFCQDLYKIFLPRVKTLTKIFVPGAAGGVEKTPLEQSKPSKTLCAASQCALLGKRSIGNWAGIRTFFHFFVAVFSLYPPLMVFHFLKKTSRLTPVPADILKQSDF